MPACLTGIATAHPRTEMSQQQSLEMARALCLHPPRIRRLLPELYRRTGISTRGSTLLTDSSGNAPAQSFFARAEDDAGRGPTTADRMRRFPALALPLAAGAAQAALADAGVAPSQITHLVTVSCTGFQAPGPEIALLQELALSSQVQRTHIGFMGCHGAFNALRVARGLIAAEPDAVVLVCAYEVCSLHFQYGSDPQHLVANAIFADGAAAAVCRDARGQGSIPDPADARGDTAHWELAASGSTLVPDSRWAMSWSIADHGFVMTLSPRVPDLIRRHLRPWLDNWLGPLGLAVESVTTWAIHPGGSRILSAAVESLGICPDQAQASQAILSRHGNMSSPTILFILDRIRHQPDRRPCVALGFGPGLTIEAMLLQ